MSHNVVASLLFAFVCSAAGGCALNGTDGPGNGGSTNPGDGTPTSQTGSLIDACTGIYVCVDPGYPALLLPLEKVNGQCHAGYDVLLPGGTLYVNDELTGTWNGNRSAFQLEVYDYYFTCTPQSDSSPPTEGEFGACSGVPGYDNGSCGMQVHRSACFGASGCKWRT